MHTRKLISLLWTGALALGLVLGAAATDARAEEAPAASKPKQAPGRAPGKAPKPEAKPDDKAQASKGKGKAGDACKVDEDCDQSSRPLTCQKSGDAGKCIAVPIHPVT